MKKIYFIYAEGCDSCAEMRRLIMDFHDKIELVEMECETNEALTYAVDNDIDDLPACKIGDIVIQGENFDGKSVTAAIQSYLQ